MFPKKSQKPYHQPPPKAMFLENLPSTIIKGNAPMDKPSPLEYCEGPNFQQPKPSTSSWNPKFYLELSSYPHSFLNLYYASIITSKKFLHNKKKISSLNHYKNYQKGWKVLYRNKD
jgi:hypothetical protein